MKDLNDNIESPFILKVSFNKFLNYYEGLCDDKDEFIAAKARRILNYQKLFPILREGFSKVSLLETYKKEIKFILQDSFSDLLSKNEIKTATVPFHNLIFNSSERFKSILKEAGKDFKLKIINMPEDDRYIIACTIILKFCYGFDLNFKRPFFYEIPDKNGVMRYYKILYNADFTEIIPTQKAKKITQEDYDELLDNFENIELWKEKFPPKSYLFKGFIISNIFDVTDDQSISNIKSSLIEETSTKNQNFSENIHEVFRSLFNIKDLKVGFSTYNKQDNTFEKAYGEGLKSFLLGDEEIIDSKEIFCERSQQMLLYSKKFYSVSDVDKYYKLTKGKVPQYRILKEQGIKSAILAPISESGNLLGVLEIVSNKPRLLNSVNANKLVDVMPYIVTAVKRSKAEEGNLIEAIIQQECTAIHPSVNWKFKKEAKLFLKNNVLDNPVSFGKITFDEVYPLYGQIDIKGSSEARNQATKQDLELQLNVAKGIIEKAFLEESLPVYEQIMFQINSYLKELEENFQVDSEQQISAFFRNEIASLFEHLLKGNKFTSEINNYFDALDKKNKVLYKHRKRYDDTVTLINKQMACLLDCKQEEAQQMYPHFFERFKTDGVEHNMYIGESITKENSFNLIYLYNLRLWQLQVMCEMENAFYLSQKDLPIPLDVASMILVFSTPLSISFRMDEKRFDVDGTYNARYEVVKKRVDKAYIKGTKKRITEKGKLTIVYSQKQDEIEYLKYIKFLQSKNYLGTEVEILELQDLQAVTGLKAIRVNVLYHKVKEDKAFYTYDDLMNELKA